MESRREEVDKLIMHLDANILLSQELIDETYSQFCNIVNEVMECTLPKIRSRSQKRNIITINPGGTRNWVKPEQK